MRTSPEQSNLWGEPKEEDEVEEAKGGYTVQTRDQWIAKSPLPKSFAAAEVCSLTRKANGYVLAFSRENEENGDCITFGSLYLSKRQVNNLIRTLKDFISEDSTQAPGTGARQSRTSE